MRSRLFAALLVAGCSPAPRPTPEVMPEVAAEYGAVYNAWDEARLRALYPADARLNPEVTREHLAWLHARLGECGAPEFMWSFGKRAARFTHACERGALESSLVLDEAGHIVSARSGAAGIPTPPELLAAANAVLASLPWTWDTKRSFEHNLNLHAAIQLGRCELVRPWVVSERGGLFHVRCDGGRAVLRLGLHANATISLAELLPASDYKGPAIER